jgi:hypothetical protein
MQNGRPGFASEQYLFDLPVNQATFNQKLGQVGTLTGTIQTTDPAVQRALLGQSPWPQLLERTAVYVDLNGQLVWGGILQQAQFQRTMHQVQIQCQDWWGYLANSRIISWNSSYTGIEQTLVAADLVNIAQGAASTSSQSPPIAAGYVVGGNVGILLGPTATQALTGAYTSNIAVTVAWAQSAFKNVGQAISDIGTASQGFDWTIDVAYSSNVPTKTFNLWYPRAGRTQQLQQASNSAVVFDLGSSSGIDYTWVGGQVAASNVMFGAGSGAGNVAIASVAADPALLDQGWPLLENSTSFTDINSQALLDQITLAYLNQTKYPISQPVIRYRVGADSNQPIGSFAIGDDIRLIIDPDDFFQSGYDSSRGNLGEQWWRVIQTQVTVQDDGMSYIDITLGTPPIFPGT